MFQKKSKETTTMKQTQCSRTKTQLEPTSAAKEKIHRVSIPQP